MDVSLIRLQNAGSMLADLVNRVFTLVVFFIVSDASALAQSRSAPPTASVAVSESRVNLPVDSTANAPDSDRPLTQAQLNAELEALENNAEISQEEKQDAATRLKQASQWLKTEQDAIQRTVDFRSQIDSAPATTARLRAELAGPTPSLDLAIPESVTLAQMEARLTELRQEVSVRQAERDAIKSQIDGRSKRLAKINKEISDIEKRVEESATQLSEPNASDYINHIRQLQLQCQRQAMAAQLTMFRAESSRMEALTDQWPLELDVATRRLNHSQRMLTRWGDIVDQWRLDESVRHAAATRRMAEKAHPALGKLATRNADIAQLRLQTVRAIEEVSGEVVQLETLTKSLDDKYRSMQSRVEHAPNATSTGILLRKQRDELPRLSVSNDRAVEMHRKMPQAHLLLKELEDERESLAEPANQAEAIVKSLEHELIQFSPEQVSGAVTGLLQTRRELLDKLIADQNTYLRNLSELEVLNEDVSKQILSFQGFLDEHVLWVRSSETLGVRDISQATVVSRRLMEPTRWNETLRDAVGESLRRPAALAAAVALLILAFVFRSHLDKRLAQLCSGPKPGAPMRMGQSLSGIGLSLILSAGWPAVLLAIGYRLTGAHHASVFSVGLGQAFLAVAAHVWGCQLVREICLEGRVGHRMFCWPPAVLVSVRRTLEMSVLFGSPLIGILVLSSHVSLDGAASLHRLTLVLTLALVSLQCSLLLRRDGAVMTSIQHHHPESMLCRLRSAIRVTAIATPIILATISIVGYHYSATQLSVRFAESMIAILGLIVIHSLALRWLRISGYNRKLRETLAAYAAKTAELESINSPSVTIASSNDATPNDPVATSAEEIKWEDTADAHVRDLLRYVTITALLIGGWFVWSDVLPALRILDRVALWNNIVDVSEMVTGPDGLTSLQTFEMNLPTTLKDGIVAILTVVATFLIARRLPAVLELTLLERLPIDRGGRDAIAILVRYATIITGMIVACKLIHISWSSVQWLAAAMTVGLGFGLQEIFANLVSGIIILFERPIRAGDIVTVGDITGHVTAMRIRATTITDYDRRELIVPNKRFITDNVINWTLSDPISRAVVKIGVAYGSDTDRVEQILVSVARRSPMTLSNPEPVVVFVGFGDSSLDFELRVFIARRETYPQVVHALNTRDQSRIESG